MYNKKAKSKWINNNGERTKLLLFLMPDYITDLYLLGILAVSNISKLAKTILSRELIIQLAVYFPPLKLTATVNAVSNQSNQDNCLTSRGFFMRTQRLIAGGKLAFVPTVHHFVVALDRGCSYKSKTAGDGGGQ